MPDKPKILIAGVGNIFHGDDAFGVETVRRLSAYRLPSTVRVSEFGIRGFDLACALLDDYETVILVDAYSHGQEPGTLYVVEPDLPAIASANPDAALLDSHAINPMRVLSLAASMGLQRKRILLIGCEPGNLGDEDGYVGLSSEVSNAVGTAAERIVSLVKEILESNQSNSPRQFFA